MTDAIPDIQLLQVSVNPEDQSEFRVLVDKTFIKYLTIDTGIYDVDNMCVAPSLISMLPPLRSGDWNQGHISRDTSYGRLYFAGATKAQFSGITKVWHPLQIDYLEFHIG
jgi:hypothetical protein